MWISKICILKNWNLVVKQCQKAKRQPTVAMLHGSISGSTKYRSNEAIRK